MARPVLVLLMMIALADHLAGTSDIFYDSRGLPKRKRPTWTCGLDAESLFRLCLSAML